MMSPEEQDRLNSQKIDAMQSDRTTLEQYSGLYVAIMFGEVKGYDADQIELGKRIKKENPEGIMLIELLGFRELSISIPSPLYIED